jgi:lysophospholipase L1-like esterase
VFGLGGVRSLPTTEDSRITIGLAQDAVAGRAHWEVFYRLDAAGDSFRLRVGDDERTVERTDAEGIESVTIEADRSAQLVIDRPRGSPRFFGVVVESSTSGVVVDTLGINGARIETPLSWDDAAWQKQGAQRAPALVVVAYGTNEVGDQVAPSRYEDQYRELLARIAGAAPTADCLVLGLPVRAAPDW